MVANKTFGQWYQDLRLPILGAAIWLLFARYIFGDSNPLAVDGILDLTTVPQGVKFWLLIAGPYWGVVGTLLMRYRYRQQSLDDSSAISVGGLLGFVGGPLLLAPLWVLTPDLKRAWITPLLAVLVLAELYAAFAVINPDNLCVTSAKYVSNQTANGLTIGLIFALMAIGLTLIYSIQGIVSFAHGQLYMLGGYFSFFFIDDIFGREVNAIFGIVLAGVLTMIVATLFELFFLRPMHTGRIERASEYAILITFGFGFFLEYSVLAGVGAIPRKLPPYLDTNRVEFLGLTFLANRLVAGGIALFLIISLLVFIRYTWWGRALRAVSMDKQAAAVVGINPNVVNTLSFGLGKLLAGMAGAALIPIFTFTPGVGAPAAVRSYVIVVLGGLGSIPGALLGGLTIGTVESLGAGCYPDITRGSAYSDAFGLIIFIVVLLIRPTGLFGRKLS